MCFKKNGLAGFSPAEMQQIWKELTNGIITADKTTPKSNQDQGSTKVTGRQSSDRWLSTPHSAEWYDPSWSVRTETTLLLVLHVSFFFFMCLSLLLLLLLHVSSSSSSSSCVFFFFFMRLLLLLVLFLLHVISSSSSSSCVSLSSCVFLLLHVSSSSSSFSKHQRQVIPSLREMFAFATRLIPLGTWDCSRLFSLCSATWRRKKEKKVHLNACPKIKVNSSPFVSPLAPLYPSLSFSCHLKKKKKDKDFYIGFIEAFAPFFIYF